MLTLNVNCRFLVAGHETTSTAVTWCLYALSQAPDVQVKLYEELMTASADMPSMDVLNALPYLDAVVRETLRVYTSVPFSVRNAMHDDVIPLNETYTDAHGQTCDSVRYVYYANIREKNIASTLTLTSS